MKLDTEALDFEAELWRRLGYFERAESAAIEAYRQGSRTAENFLRQLYRLRRGSDDAFQQYFEAKLVESAPPADAGRSAPQFRAATLDGSSIASDSLKGTVVVVNFWFIGCGPCRAEMPELNLFVEDLTGQARFLAFALDPAEALRPFLASTTFRYEVVPEGGQVARAFDVKGYPTHVVIDREGKIAWEARGASPDNVKRLRAVVERLTRR